MNNAKKGLVFGGGGTKGSYSIGAAMALQKLGLHYEITAGTSIGAVAGVMYAQQQLDGLKDWVQSFVPETMTRGLFEFPDRYTVENLQPDQTNAFLAGFSANGPSIAALKSSLQTIYNYEKLQASPVDYACLTWNMSKGQPEAFFKKDCSEQTLLDAILASCAYFPAFNFVEINGDYYADGGYAQTIPWSLAREMGAGPLTIISLQDPGQKQSLPPDGIEYLIRPLLKLHYFLDFTPSNLLAQMEQGYLECLKYLDAAPGCLYTFYPEDWPEIQKLEDRLEELLKKKNFTLDEAMLDQMQSALLGYTPWKLENTYMKSYRAGRVLEALALCAQISPYQQYHFSAFCQELIEKMSHFGIDLNIPVRDGLYASMQKAGIKDLVVFFHSAFASFGGSLPATFDVMKQNFILPWYLGLAWYLLELYLGKEAQ